MNQQPSIDEARASLVRRICSGEVQSTQELAVIFEEWRLSDERRGALESVAKIRTFVAAAWPERESR